jgi:hypothetical protein
MSVTNSITVSYNNSALSGYITVKGSNSFGEGASSSLMITVNPVYHFVEEHSICEGDSYNWHGYDYTISNTYNAYYTTSTGCDSIYTLHLSVNPVYHFTEEYSICEGETYNWHGSEYSSSNTYTTYYTSINGCDSIYTLYLKVNPSYHFTEEHSICYGDTYRWHGNDYLSTNTYFDNYTTITGCDSIYILNLKVNPVYYFTEEHSMCYGEIFDWHGNKYSNAGLYTDEYITSNGCDSIYKLFLFVESIPTTVSLNGNTAFADSAADTYQWLNCDDNFQPVLGANEQNFTPISSGKYAVILTRGLCSDTSDCVQIIISDVDIDNSFELDFSILPNPASEYIEISFGADSRQMTADGIFEGDIRIYNTLGECLISKEQITSTVQRIDVSGLPNGIYFLKVNDKFNKFAKY